MNSADSSPSPTSPPRENTLFDELISLMQQQERSTDDIDRVRKAFVYARDHHEGQKRKNQENYIVHPVSVALILAGIPLDTTSLISALLHDTLEDTDATADEIQTHFAEEVRTIVEGVTKLGKLAFTSTEDRQAENFRRMFLAMAKDARVVMVKLGDRLHNMRTLDHMPVEKQQRIATETLEIFGPMANRMGMGKLRSELEDLSLKYLHPNAYDDILDSLAQTRADRERTIEAVIARIQDQLDTMRVEATIRGRIKNTYSIYKKMMAQQKTIQDIFDISAVRVVVSSEKECYEVLGVIHHAFKPIPGKFKDYIAMPKGNLYQSLHTTVIGPAGRPMEVQIRTEDMHRIAEYGIAAHWKYKESGGSNTAMSDDDQKLSWLKRMLEMKDDAQDATEYVESVKLDLFRDEVFVFTPKGQVLDLPQGSTPVDFAYRIHTEVGHTCTGAMVNGKMVTLDYPLQNGDIVEINTIKKGVPRLDWMHFVQTQTSKTRIRQWFRKNLKTQHIQQGKRMLEDALTRNKVSEETRSGELVKIALDLNYVTLDDMVAAIGFGELSLTKVMGRLQKTKAIANQEDVLKRIEHFRRPAKQGKAAAKADSEIMGLQGMLHQLAKCCLPVPGEDIIGVVTRSRGVMIHRADCVNLSHVNPDRMMSLDWVGETAERKKHMVRLDAHVIDRVGVMKDLLGKVADINTNVSDIRVKLMDDNMAMIQLTVEVSNRIHLEKVILSMQRIPDVLGIKRHQISHVRPTDPHYLNGDNVSEAVDVNNDG